MGIIESVTCIRNSVHTAIVSGRLPDLFALPWFPREAHIEIIQLLEFGESYFLFLPVGKCAFD